MINLNYLESGTKELALSASRRVLSVSQDGYRHPWKEPLQRLMNRMRQARTGSLRRETPCTRMRQRARSLLRSWQGNAKKRRLEMWRGLARDWWPTGSHQRRRTVTAVPKNRCGTLSRSSRALCLPELFPKERSLECVEIGRTAS